MNNADMPFSPEAVEAIAELTDEMTPKIPTEIWHLYTIQAGLKMVQSGADLGNARIDSLRDRPRDSGTTVQLIGTIAEIQGRIALVYALDKLMNENAERMPTLIMEGMEAARAVAGSKVASPNSLKKLLDTVRARSDAAVAHYKTQHTAH